MALCCLLEMWLSVATPVRPFLTDQQREESFPAPSINNWAPEDLKRAIQLWGRPAVDKNPFKPSSVKMGDQFYILGFSCKCIVRLCLAQKLLSWVRWPMPDEHTHTLLWNGSSSFKWQTNEAFHCKLVILFAPWVCGRIPGQGCLLHPYTEVCTISFWS